MTADTTATQARSVRTRADALARAHERLPRTSFDPSQGPQREPCRPMRSLGDLLGY
jgi:hypothetical protein